MESKFYSNLIISFLLILLPFISILSQVSHEKTETAFILLADNNFKRIPDISLKTEVIEAGSAKSENLRHELVLKTFPNPVKGNATIYYTLPLDGSVTLDLHNAIGNGVGSLVKEYKVAGKYVWKFDISSLPEGIYLTTVKLHNNNVDLVKTVKLLVSR
jgi:Secretion system C-terminal sorting domain